MFFQFWHWDIVCLQDRKFWKQFSEHTSPIFLCAEFWRSHINSPNAWKQESIPPCFLDRYTCWQLHLSAITALSLSWQMFTKYVWSCQHLHTILMASRFRSLALACPKKQQNVSGRLLFPSRLSVTFKEFFLKKYGKIDYFGRHYNTTLSFPFILCSWGQ